MSFTAIYIRLVSQLKNLFHAFLGFFYLIWTNLSILNILVWWKKYSTGRNIIFNLVGERLVKACNLGTPPKLYPHEHPGSVCSLALPPPFRPSTKSEQTKSAFYFISVHQLTIEHTLISVPVKFYCCVKIHHLSSLIMSGYYRVFPA